MHRNKVIFLFIITTALMFSAGCSTIETPPTTIQYYTLEYDPPAPEQNMKTIPAIIRIERFSAVNPFDDAKMAFREKPYSLDTYHYEKWRAKPGDMVSFFLSRDMKSASLFKGVFLYVGQYEPTHVVEGSVEGFYEKDGEKNWEAVMEVSVTLIRADRLDILFQKRYRFYEPAPEKTPKGVAQAMSAAMKSFSAAVTEDITAAISQTSK